jgi:hypothetical protein
MIPIRVEIASWSGPVFRSRFDNNHATKLGGLAANLSISFLFTRQRQQKPMKRYAHQIQMSCSMQL